MSMPLGVIGNRERGVNAQKLFHSWSIRLAVAFAVILFSLGCGGSGGNGSTSSQISVQISPLSPTMAPGTLQAFNATVTGTTNTAVVWSCSGGTIDQLGSYTAPMTQAFYTVTATSAADSSVKATVQVTVSLTSSVKVTISPVSISVSGGNQVQYVATVTGTANTAVTWSATAGSVDSNGLYTSPITPGIYRVTAKSVATPSKTAVGIVTVTAPSIRILPGAPTMGTHESMTFTATIFNQSSQAVTWSATGGTITSFGVYSAGEFAGTYTITATSVAQPTISTTISVTLKPIVITVSPNPVSVVLGQTQQFTASISGPNNKAIRWSTSAGLITTSGLFTAPTTAQTVTVTASSMADAAIVGRSVVTVVTPSTFFYDFNSGVSSVWVPTTNETTPSGVKFLGRISGVNSAQLTLGTLTKHSTLTVEYDLFVIGAWGGIPNNSNFTMTVDATSGFSQSFSNLLNVSQSYPLSGTNAPGTGSTGQNTLGFVSSPAILYNDTTYHLTSTVNHTNATAIIAFAGNLTGTLANMSWGLKNVRITANP